MTRPTDLPAEKLRELAQRARADFDAFVRRGLSLNMARGKPSPEQLDLSNSLLQYPGPGHHQARDGTDCRNYGGLQGLPEIRELLAPLMGADPANIVAAGNASLALMHDCIVFALLKGTPDSGPWSREAPVRFLCPAPGYDRHFAICEEYGIEMINVALGDDGPDMDQVERLAAADPAIKGIWCVPKYANPTGAIYSDEIVERLARMPAAAPDFRVFWDNAYALHHLTEERVTIANLLERCEAAGQPDRALVFGSTSKITFAGSGVALLAASKSNVAWFLHHMGKRTIGPDKINQLRHADMLPDWSALEALMDGHRRIMAPKFEAVDSVFGAQLSEPEIARWTRPKGGYFMNLEVPPGCARRAIALAAEAGITLTGAGAAFPYGRDPDDSNIRIAPTFPALDDVEEAAEGIACAVRVTALEQASARG